MASGGQELVAFDIRFNSALHRIAAAADRITDRVKPPLGARPRSHAQRRREVFGDGVVVRVCEEVNLLKHEFVGRTERKGVTLEEALQAARDVADVAVGNWAANRQAAR